MPRNRRRLVEDDEDDDIDAEAELAMMEAQGEDPPRAPGTGGRGSLSQTAANTNRLLINGEAQPSYVIKNRQDFGYVSPRIEFIQAPAMPTYRDLALTWGVSQDQISTWASDQQWVRQRENYQAELNDKMWQLGPDDLISLRNSAIARGVSSFKQMQELALEMARRGTKERILPNGRIQEMSLDTQDLVRLTKAIEAAVRGEVVLLGLNFKIAQEEALNNDNQTPATSTVYYIPATPEELAQINSNKLALPQGEGGENNTQGEAVEGIVVG